MAEIAEKSFAVAMRAALEDTVMTLLGADSFSLSRRRLVRRKWPRWLTPNARSKPSSVFSPCDKPSPEMEYGALCFEMVLQRSIINVNFSAKDCSTKIRCQCPCSCIRLSYTDSVICDCKSSFYRKMDMYHRLSYKDSLSMSIFLEQTVLQRFVVNGHFPVTECPTKIRR